MYLDRQTFANSLGSTLFATQSEISHTLVVKKYKVESKSVNKQGKCDIPDSGRF